MFSIRNVLKQGDVLLPLLLNCALQYVINIVQVIQDGLQLNDTHQLLIYANYVNILDGSYRSLKENAECSLVVSKETGLEVNADKIKYFEAARCRFDTRNRLH
jgi:hypothetical protein